MGGGGIIAPMRSAVIVYNPAAGRFPVKPFIHSAVEELEAAGWQVDVLPTQSGAHTVELARQAADAKKDAVFAVGGDGTIGNVVNGLLKAVSATEWDIAHVGDRANRSWHHVIKMIYRPDTLYLPYCSWA